MSENKKVKEKKRKLDNVKKPTGAGMLFTIYKNTFHLFMKNTLIGNYGASCHINNDDTGLHDTTERTSW